MKPNEVLRRAFFFLRRKIRLALGATAWQAVRGVSATDARTFVGTAALLLLVAAIASFAPAMRILRMNSAEILRNE